MKFLNFIRHSFDRVLAVDTEFLFDTTKTIPEKVICFVYTDIFTGEVTRKWVYGKEARVYPLNFKRIRRSVWDNCLNKKRLPLTEIKKPKSSDI